MVLPLHLRSPANLQVKGSDGVGSAVGGAIGGCVALLAIIASITCVVVVLVKNRYKQKPTGIQENNGMGFENAIYEGGKLPDSMWEYVI